MPVVLKKCKCKSTLQDRLHGKGRRVHTLCDNGKSCRCGKCKTVVAIEDGDPVVVEGEKQAFESNS